MMGTPKAHARCATPLAPVDEEYGITATIEGSLDLKLNLTQMADGFSGQEHSFPIMPL